MDERPIIRPVDWRNKTARGLISTESKGPTLMRKFLVLFIGLLAASHALAANEIRPNIIFILADDLGPGDISCYGGTSAKTPNIDRLAKEGIRFDPYYVASPVCSPSRCSLITGQFPARWNI